jgi:hypothetical protein
MENARKSDGFVPAEEKDAGWPYKEICRGCDAFIFTLEIYDSDSEPVEL